MKKKFLLFVIAPLMALGCKHRSLNFEPARFVDFLVDVSADGTVSNVRMTQNSVG